MKNRFFILVLLIIAIVVLGAVYIVFTDKNTASQKQSPTPTIARILTPTPIVEKNTDWQTYTSNELNFSINHPPDVQVSSPQDGEIRFMKFGPTQKEGTEFYDGISISVMGGTITGNTFAELVESKHNELQNEPIIDSISPIKKDTLNGYETYIFTINGLGTFTHYYINLNGENYVDITIATVDPGNLGFEEIANQIISSIKAI